MSQSDLFPIVWKYIYFLCSVFLNNYFIKFYLVHDFQKGYINSCIVFLLFITSTTFLQTLTIWNFSDYLNFNLFLFDKCLCLAWNTAMNIFIHEAFVTFYISVSTYFLKHSKSKNRNNFYGCLCTAMLLFKRLMSIYNSTYSIWSHLFYHAFTHSVC